MLRPGLRVRIHGLQKKKDRKRNGKIARVMTKQDLTPKQQKEGRVWVKIVGDAAGEAAGKAAGEAAGETAGEATGEAAGEAGAAVGAMAGEVAGEASRRRSRRQSRG